MNNLRRRKFTLTGLRATLLLLLLSLQTNVFGQGNPMVSTYPGRFNLKHYSTTQVPPGGPVTPGTVGAGTYFSGVATGNPNWTHFVNLDDLGAVTAWKYMQESSTDCIDERSVHIVNNPNNPHEYFLTSLVRFDNTLGSFHDCIKIYVTDENGNIMNDGVISSTGNEWENLYPMNSLFHNGFLYVCGYALKGNSIPLYDYGPTYIANSFSTTSRWEKAAFVAKIDPYAAPISTPINIQFFDYVPTYMGYGLGYFPDPGVLTGGYAAANQPGQASDFDMAMRLTLLNKGNPGNEWLHVTGSVSVMDFRISRAPAPLESENQSYNCGVMNLTLDPVNLNILNDQPFKAEREGFEGWTGAMGVGIVQVDNISNPFDPGYFIIGNHYTPEIWVTGPDVGGYHPVPHNMFAAFLDGGNHMGNLYPQPWYNDIPIDYDKAGLGAALNAYKGFTLTQRYNSLLCFGNSVDQQGDEWAVNVIECSQFLDCAPFLQSGNPATPGVNIWIAGYKGGFASSNYDITMTKLDMSFDFNSSIVTTVPSFLLYNTCTTYVHTNTSGTGPILNTNNFFTLGRGLSNMLFSPTFATLYDNNIGNAQLAALGPKWNAGSLNMKMIRGRLSDSKIADAFNVYCSGSYSEYTPPDTAGYNIVAPHGIDMDIITNVSNGPGTSKTHMTAIGIDNPASDICSLTGNYKGTAIKTIKDDARTVVYPNPAGTEVFIEVAKNMNMAEEVQVVLLNMYGKECGRLYQGKPDGLGANHPIQLPAVANGVYMIQMYGGGKLLLNEKLNIVK